MADLLEIAERLWSGEGSTDVGGHHPVMQDLGLAEVADDTAFVESFANVAAFRTADGLCLVDTGSAFAAPAIHAAVRGWDAGRLHTAVYTHGHIDHVFGMAPFEAEARSQGWAPPHVVAHELVPPRFERYVLTAGYNGVINQRQFQFSRPFWPTEYRHPDEVYRAQLSVDVGGER